MDTTKLIYLVDDDQDDRFFIRSALQESGVKVNIVEVENGLDLIKLIQQNDSPLPALILLDMNMPKMNGLETTSALRADPHIQQVPIVMISTSANHTLIESAYEVGVNDFMPKPSTFEEFSSLGSQLAHRFLS
jgi:CheY-like chemotaxis protein